jgi:ABC-type multidrug transport system ATPase subunit
MAFGSFVLMRDLNFAINRGDVFIIMGGSGSGKSTLLRHMIGLIEAGPGETSFTAIRTSLKQSPLKTRITPAHGRAFPNRRALELHDLIGKHRHAAGRVHRVKFQRDPGGGFAQACAGRS